MFYTTAREYALMQGLTIRSPSKLLDSRAANKALLFSKQFNCEVPFLMNLYGNGWQDGWRTYDMESIESLKNSLRLAGVDMTPMRELEFAAFMAPEGEGERALSAAHRLAEDSGCVGVPHYRFQVPSGKIYGLFGREHLSLIRGKMHDSGLARRADVIPEFSHTWRPEYLCFKQDGFTGIETGAVPRGRI
jgi:hypothetical protein